MRITDIHTHRIYEEGIMNTAPSLFIPQKGIYYSVGIHPWSVAPDYHTEWEILQSVASHPQVLAIGEAGIDRVANSNLPLQEEVFALQIQLSERLKKPMIIHCVRSVDKIIASQKRFNPSMPWVIHGFRGNKETAAQLIARGFYLSFGEKYQPEALRETPSERFFIETDESKETIAALYRKAAGYLCIPEEKLAYQAMQNIKGVFFAH